MITKDLKNFRMESLVPAGLLNTAICAQALIESQLHHYNDRKMSIARPRLAQSFDKQTGGQSHSHASFKGSISLNVVGMTKIRRRC